MEKVENVQEEIAGVSGDTETLKKNQKEMLDIENTVTEIKSAFDELISRLDMPEERTESLRVSRT